MSYQQQFEKLQQRHAKLYEVTQAQNELLETIKAERDALAAQLVAVKASGGTGQSPCAKFCESVATWKDFYQLREHSDRLHVENCDIKRVNAELAAQVEQLKELASFWIYQAEPKRGSKQEYNTWLALGYESACMRLSPKQLERIKQQGGAA